MRITKNALDNLKDWTKKRDDIPEGWLYIGDDKERYVLGQPGFRNILVFGGNPGTATPGENNLDPTIRKVRNLVKEQGCDGWIMVNLYPLRATDSNDLPEAIDKKMHENNLKVLKAIENSYSIERIWAAWGNTIDTRFYLGEALNDINEVLTSAEWYYLGKLTKQGNPRHPLYMKSGEEFNWFPVTDYAANWLYPDCYF